MQENNCKNKRYNYNDFVDNEGFVFSEEKYGEIENKKIRAFFLSDPQYIKQVFLWFDLIPEQFSAKDIPILTDDPSEDITTYVTKKGLICTINKKEDPNHFLNVIIIYDSENFGSAMYRLEFSSGIDMEEVKAILESIPLIDN
ncbi:MAG: hypothetical protein GX270_09705 [Clostridiaceae bacterium]|nr:hypothetical protein [Clostridiaceae bacterium]